MKRPGRTLTPDEAALWERLAATVRPMRRVVPPRYGEGDRREAGVEKQVRPGPAPRVGGKPAVPLHQPAAGPPSLLSLSKGGEAPRPLDRHTLDSTWDRKLARGVVQPDFTLDLHGHTLESAHARLDHGLTQALAQGARVLLLITGKSRGESDHSSRGERRGAIRAKFLDWLAAGPHASRIAAIRPAHPRHGGAGAVYIILKRSR